MLKDARVSDEDITFVAERDQLVRIVSLTMDAGGTKISLVRLNKSAPPADATPAPVQPAATQQDPVQ